MVNVTNLTQINTFSDAGRVVTAATDGLFWIIILIALFIVMVFRYMQNTSYDDAILGSSFICFVLSLVLLRLEWTQPVFPIIFGVLIAGTLAYKKFSVT